VTRVIAAYWSCRLGEQRQASGFPSKLKREFSVLEAAADGCNFNDETKARANAAFASVLGLGRRFFASKPRWLVRGRSTARRSDERENKRSHMPRGYYSHTGENENEFWFQGTQHSAASIGETGRQEHSITEPGCGTGFQSSQAPEEIYGVQAKEPDRPAARRGSKSGRGSSRMTSYEEAPARRSKARPSSSRKGAQARRATERGPARRTAAPTARTSRAKKSRRGFAAMSPEQQREIARKGGLTVSRNRRHMAEIGRIGGERSHGGRQSRSRR
jgi:uncharacterized protein